MDAGLESPSWKIRTAANSSPSPYAVRKTSEKPRLPEKLVRKFTDERLEIEKLLEKNSVAIASLQKYEPLLGHFETFLEEKKQG